MQFPRQGWGEHWEQKRRSVMYEKFPLMIRYNEAWLNVSTSAEWQVMNEVALHRGSSPHLNTIDVFVDGQHLTEAVVRGFIIVRSILLNHISVRWLDCRNPDRIDSIFPISGRPHSPPRIKRNCPDANMSTKFIFPTISVPVIVIYHSPGTSYTYCTEQCQADSLWTWLDRLGTVVALRQGCRWMVKYRTS